MWNVHTLYFWIDHKFSTVSSIHMFCSCWKTAFALRKPGDRGIMEDPFNTLGGDTNMQVHWLGCMSCKEPLDGFHVDGGKKKSLTQKSLTRVYSICRVMDLKWEQRPVRECKLNNTNQECCFVQPLNEPLPCFYYEFRLYWWGVRGGMNIKRLWYHAAERRPDWKHGWICWRCGRCNTLMVIYYYGKALSPCFQALSNIPAPSSVVYSHYHFVFFFLNWRLSVN